MPYLFTDKPDPEPLDCRIMTAALALFVDRGFHNVSVHDIQQAAGVSIGSIYKHFGGKEGIAQRLYAHLLGEMDQLIARALAEHEGTVARCNAVIRYLFECSESHRYIMAFLLDAKHTEFLSDGLPVYSSAPFETLGGVLTEGIARGEIKPVAPVVALTLVFGSAIRLINLRFEGSVASPLMDYYAELTEAVWSGLTPQGDA